MDGASSAAEHAIACDVWEAVRLLSDAELQALQQRILDAHSDAGLRIPLGARAWTLPTLLSVLTNHIHDMVHKANNAVADAPSAVASLTAPSTPSHAHHKSADPATPDFALRKDEFPSLSNQASKPTMNVTSKANKPSKRRITTTLVSAKEAHVAVRVVSPPAAFPPLGVKSKRGAATSVWPKQDLLERRMVANQLFADAPVVKNFNPQTKQPNPVLETPVKRKPLVIDNQVEHAWPQVHTPPSSTASPWGMQTPDSPPLVRVKAMAPQPPSVDKLRRLRRVALVQSESDPISNQDEEETSLKKPVTAEAFSANLQAAKLYGFLIQQKFVANTCTELQVIMSMLFRQDCAACTEAISFGSSNQEHEACAQPTEFCWQIHCRAFAAIVCDAIESVISYLGSDLLQLIIQCLSDAGVCIKLTDRLRAVAQTREQWRVEESARIGCKLPIETKASAVRDFALPFCEEVDSRLHYRTPTESLLYTNREKVRDGFLSILRQFQRQQHSLLGMDQANVVASAAQAARALLAEVTPENRWWFAKFFVMELVQVGSNPFGESDKDLVLKIMEDKLVGKNPDRLRKLHRRFSSQKQSTGGGAAVSNHHINNHHQSGPSNGPTVNRSKANPNKTAPLQRSDNGGSANVKDQSMISASDKAVMDRMRSFLGENQLFFFHFLHSCDSFEFSQLVQHQIEWQFLSLWNAKSDSADPRKTFTDVVLKLKVLAKFLGYLRFSPQWHASSTFLPLATQNAAFRAAQQEAVRTLETSSHHSGRGVDVLQILEQSIVEGRLSKCIPWLCDYLMMLSLDKLSSEMRQVKQLLVLLEQVYRSPRLAALGETGLYIRMQIERVFQVLDMDVATGLRANKNAIVQSNDRLLEALMQTDASVSRGENGVDTLPFLYSQVFLESCVSELDDLRGYIQTRAKPSHRVAKRATSANFGQQQGLSIRKLRPLHVVTEEVATSKGASNSKPFRSEEPVEQENDDDDEDDEHDPLAESLFKLHPGMKKSAEFVVDAVVTNVCEHVMIHVVTHRADEFVDSCLKSSGWPTRKDSNVIDSAASVSAAADMFAKTLDTQMEQRMSQSVADAMQEAIRLCEERVQASLPLLIAPSSHHTLVQCVTNIALKRTRRAVNNVVPKSSRTEFKKRIAARKKRITKEVASVSAIAARSKQDASTPDVASITRTLCSMFDAHVGKEDDDDDDEDEEFRTENGRVVLMKQCGADIVKLAAQMTSPTSTQGLDTFTRQQNLLVRQLRRLIKILVIHEVRTQLQVVNVALCELTWRVMVSCLQCVAALGDGVNRWHKKLLQHERLRLSLETSIEAFSGQFSLLLEAMLTVWSGNDKSKTSERVASLISFMQRSLLRIPSSLFGIVGSGNNDESTDELGDLDVSLVQAFIVKPRARLVALIDKAVAPQLRLDWSQWLEHESNRSRSAEEIDVWRQIRDLVT